MSKKCTQNLLFSNGFSIIFQVIFIFAFLTIFFFAYVVTVEKGEFQTQINLIIDDIVTQDAIKGILPKGVIGLTPENEDIILSGILDVIDTKISLSSRDAVVNVNNDNAAIRRKAFIVLGVTAGVLVISTIALLMAGFCIQILYEVKEALWVVLFVGITELLFLSVIAKSYISADPNAVKRSIGIAIQKWIATNKTIPSPSM